MSNPDDMLEDAAREFGYGGDEPLEFAPRKGDFDPSDRDPSSAPLGATIVNWRELPSVMAAETWAELRAWVDWFVVRYDQPATAIPPCWYKHGRLVEELTALRTAHQVAFDPTDSGLGPITWHERLTLALARLKTAYAGGCSQGHYQSSHDKPSVDEEDWAAWISQPHGT